MRLSTVAWYALAALDGDSRPLAVSASWPRICRLAKLAATIRGSNELAIWCWSDRLPADSERRTCPPPFERGAGWSPYLDLSGRRLGPSERHARGHGEAPLASEVTGSTLHTPAGPVPLVGGIVARKS